MAIRLTTLLRDLATLYRRYGDIEVMVETPHHIYRMERVDDDLWNVDDNVTAILETEHLEFTHDNPLNTPTPDHKQPHNNNNNNNNNKNN